MLNIPRAVANRRERLLGPDPPHPDEPVQFRQGAVRGR